MELKFYVNIFIYYNEYYYRGLCKLYVKRIKVFKR